MARLNESTTSVESLETQSEVSHLLAENVSLREQTIALGQEMERYEAAKSLHDGVYDIKNKLENKLTELNNLVIGLGTLPRQFNKAYSERVDDGRQRDLAQSNWDLRHDEAKYERSFAPEQDWRLPVIPEDGSCPRDKPRSCELDESMESTATPNPQRSEDAITRIQLEEDTLCLQPGADFADNRLDDSGINDTFLPPTLETRKKRKYNASWSEDRFNMKSESVQSHNTSEDTQGTDVLLNCRTESDTFGATPADDDFKFSRPTVFGKCERDQPCGDKPAEESLEVKSDSMYHGQPKRRALKPKNANMNVVSSGRRRTPTKGKHSEIPSFPGDVQSDGDQPTKSTADENNCHRESKPTERCDSADNANHRNERKRKSTTTKPDCTKEEVNSPSALISLATNETTNETSAIPSDPPSRPSRRQRAVVSYAEPNLRDKMRRSNNELIAAVGNGQSRRASSHREPKTDRGDEFSGRTIPRANSRSLDMDAAALFSEESSMHQLNSISQRKRKISPSLDYKIVSGKCDASNDSTASPIMMSPSYEKHPERKSITELQTDMERHVRQPVLENMSDASMELGDMWKTASCTKTQPRRHSTNQRSHLREPPLQQSKAVSSRESPDAASPSFSPILSPSSDLVMDETSASSANLQAPNSGNPHNQSTASLEIGPGQKRRAKRVSARRRSMML
ncbi:shugoshin family protein [Aspergillus affinis]|uniref:shugoshin family protein n=1 Tax=Aspergillus affinis TaxID=1070780 RepID=UPI0022FE2B49|nr:uncharacterized protein KD926_010737 [Aspergillus affinis]KAI9038524.1 hypothetical protein KD926_010737 [Aspergillus affinis]